MRARWFVLSSLPFFAITAIAIVFFAGGGSAPTRYAEEHPVSIPAASRTIQVSRSMPMPSAQPRHLSAMLEQGSMPAHVMTGTVLSDTECAPDASSISHCRNEVRLPDGSTIVLRHPHDMAHIPCLAPGEHVRLLPATA